MSADTHCPECDGTGDVFTGVEHGGMQEVLPCPVRIYRSRDLAMAALRRALIGAMT